MKKIFLLFALGLFVNTISAQVKPYVGIKAGLNFTNYDIEADFDYKSNTGFHIGAVGHLPLGEKAGLQLEALYSAEQAATDYDTVAFNEVDLDYIEVPLLFTYNLTKGLQIQAGPQFELKVNSEVSLNDGIDFGTDEDSIKQEIEDDFKSMNFDAAVGVQYTLPAIGIFAQARYVYGITDISETMDLTSNQFLLSVGMKF